MKCKYDMNVAIVKYNAGNIRSVVNAVRRLGVEPVLTDDADMLRTADRVIFPGQGEAGTTMAYLRQHGLDSVIKSLTQPVLGICIGMQLLCRHSEEGNTDCLGVFDAEVKRFPHAEITKLKVPQMGWNTFEPVGEHAKWLGEEGYAYFIHSYYVPLCDDTAAATEYGIRYSSALQRDNFYATQFHPEKSGSVGETILRNWLAHS